MGYNSWDIQVVVWVFLWSIIYMCFWESINSQRFCTGSHTPHWFIRAYGSPLIGIPVQALDDHPSYKDRWRVDRPPAHMVTFWHPGLLCSDEIHKNVGRKWANWASQSCEWHGFVMDSCLVVTIMMIHNLGWPLPSCSIISCCAGDIFSL